MAAPEGVTVDLLASHPELIAAVGEMRWREWGYGDPSPAGHVEITRREAGKESLPITLVAIGPRGEALGAVGLDGIDNELSAAERNHRTPWLIGMVVRADSRRRGIGRALVSRLERTSVEFGSRRVWVATGDHAVGFYRRCSWEPVQWLRLTSTGIDTTILTRYV
jgi:GNAT superfamily N-acetyltransferase